MDITFDNLVDFICDRFGFEKQEVIDKDSFEELGLDSLTLYSIVSKVETMYSIQIDTDDITEINTVSNMYRYISKKNEGR